MKMIVLSFFLSFSSMANVIDGASFTMIKKLIQAAGFESEVYGTKGGTFFAPTNDAFKEIATEDIESIISDKELLRNILSYHLIEGRKTLNSLKHAKAFESKNGKLIRVFQKDADILINDAKVLSVDPQRRRPTVVGIDRLLDYGSAFDYSPKTAKNIDLNKYLGTWYEIGRFDHSFQEGCVGARAEYTHKWYGVKVVNTCLEPNGETSEGRAVARLDDKNDASRLKVSFIPALKYFGIGQGDYLILKLDKDYQVVLVGDYTRTNLWVLSRRPVLDQLVVEEYLEYAKSQGYDISGFNYSEEFPVL